MTPHRNGGVVDHPTIVSFQVDQLEVLRHGWIDRDDVARVAKVAKVAKVACSNDGVSWGGVT